jgi:positive regulator of sigma E activity
MFARLSARAMLVAGLAAMVFFGIGLIGLAVATWLSAKFGVAGGYLIAGAILLAIPALWMLIWLAARPRKKPQEKPDFASSIFASVARETPWAAVLGAGLVGIANLFLNRNRNKK